MKLYAEEDVSEGRNTHRTVFEKKTIQNCIELSILIIGLGMDLISPKLLHLLSGTSNGRRFRENIVRNRGR